MSEPAPAAIEPPIAVGERVRVVGHRPYPGQTLPIGTTGMVATKSTVYANGSFRFMLLHGRNVWKREAAALEDE